MSTDANYNILLDNAYRPHMHQHVSTNLTMQTVFYINIVTVQTKPTYIIIPQTTQTESESVCLTCSMPYYANRT